MSRLISEIEHSPITVHGTKVVLVQQVWDNGGQSWDVILVATDQLLTMDESFDERPTEDQLISLISNHIG